MALSTYQELNKISAYIILYDNIVFSSSSSIFKNVSIDHPFFAFVICSAG